MTAVTAAVVAAVSLTGCGDDATGVSHRAATATAAGPVVLLDRQSETILGQPVVYGTGTAQVSSSIITLQPGDETGWHHHDAPLYGYILAGTLRVDYGDAGTRTYATGDALLEAIGTPHNGAAVGDEPVTILVVNIGSSDEQNTVVDDQR